MKLRFLSIPLLVAAAVLAPSSAHAERLRDLADVAGARDNQLIGYGIVTGLNGTGDDTSSPFAAQSVMSMLRRLGVQVDPTQVRLRNVAAVVVTTSIGAFAKPGSKLDVTVSSLGNAKSLSGGVLVQTLLRGADQKTYAVAQGSVLTVAVKPGASQAPVTTTGRVPAGGIVEREIVTTFVEAGAIKLSLRAPSFTLAARAADAIDKRFGPGTAKAEDGGGISVKIPAAFAKKPVELIAELEEVEVGTVRKARVVVSERTQTIVAGGDVRLSPAVVVHDGITIVVKDPQKPVPKAAPRGMALVGTKAPETPADAEKTVHYVKPAASLGDVAGALGALGLSSRELASVLEALRTAGALEAEVVIQ